MRAVKSRAAVIGERSYTVRWDMNALFLYAAHKGIKTIDEAEASLNALLLVIHEAESKSIHGLEISTVKDLSYMVCAATDNELEHHDAIRIFGEGGLDNALEHTITAYVENLPEFEAGITADAPANGDDPVAKHAKKKSKLASGKSMNMLQRWGGNLVNFGLAAWGSFTIAIVAIRWLMKGSGSKRD